MLLTRKIFDTIIKEYREGAYEAFQKAEATMQSLSNITKKMVELQMEFGGAMQLLRERIALLQSECDHPSVTYQPDPSGNNDSSMECDVCGKEVH